MLGTHVVLIEPNTDIGGRDFHQFGKRILQAAANRDRTADRRIVLRQLLPPKRARGVDARPSLVHDHILKPAICQRPGHQFGDEVFRLTSSGTVTNRDHLHVVLLHQGRELGRGLLAFL